MNPDKAVIGPYTASVNASANRTLEKCYSPGSGEPYFSPLGIFQVLIGGPRVDGYDVETGMEVQLRGACGLRRVSSAL